MYINSQFFISYYPGAQPLDLMSVPPSISGNADALLTYNRFMQNIVSIYASQNSSGTIPVFWTRRDDQNSGFGTGQVAFSPSENSTLQKLQPKAGYYFILRDESALPLQIPVVSGESQVLLESSETFNVPSISFTDTVFDRPSPGAGSLSIEPTNSQIVAFDMSRLENGETYKYEFKHVDNNWPVTFSPVSGTFKPILDSATIKSNLKFCATTGCCSEGDPGLLHYPESVGVSGNNDTLNLYQIYRLEITPISFEADSILSDDITAICKDCLPNMRVFNLTAESTEFADYTLSEEGVSLYSWFAFFDNLTPGKSYEYQVNVLDANWPVIFNTSTSGTFTAANREFIKPMSISFCPAPSFCPVDNESVFAYNQAAKFVESYYISMNISVRSTSCDAQEQYTSYSTTIYCNNCL